MTGTFIDTIIICTMTGLTLVVTGVWSGDASGAAMTSLAFAQGLDAHVGQYLVSIGLLFFAFTTILGWNYYGERCTEYLFGVKAIKPYRLVYLALVASGAFLHLDMIWLLADIVNGLMAVPNLIGLIGLRHVVIAETRAYFSRDLDSEAEPEPADGLNASARFTLLLKRTSHDSGRGFFVRCVYGWVLSLSPSG